MKKKMGDLPEKKVLHVPSGTCQKNPKEGGGPPLIKKKRGHGRTSGRKKEKVPTPSQKEPNL